MRLTPNRLTSALYRDPVTSERHRDRTPLDSTQKAHGQTDEGITVTDLLHLVRARLSHLGSGATTLPGLAITQQLRPESFQSGLRFRHTIKEKAPVIGALV
jgi:hypothetical protein